MYTKTTPTIISIILGFQLIIIANSFSQEIEKSGMSIPLISAFPSLQSLEEIRHKSPIDWKEVDLNAKEIIDNVTEPIPVIYAKLYSIEARFVLFLNEHRNQQFNAKEKELLNSFLTEEKEIFITLNEIRKEEKFAINYNEIDQKILFYHAFTNELLNNYEEALYNFENLIAKYTESPINDAVYFHIMKILIKTRSLDDSIKYFEMLANTKPDCRFIAFYYCAQINVEHKLYDKAEVYLQKALEGVDDVYKINRAENLRKVIKYNRDKKIKIYAK